MEIFYFLNRFRQCSVWAAYTYYDFQSHSFWADKGDAGVLTSSCQRQDAYQLFLILVVDVYHDVSLVSDECGVRTSAPVAGREGDRRQLFLFLIGYFLSLFLKTAAYILNHKLIF